MFLRSTARSAGLTARGQPMQATYVAALEGGRIAGVAAHCWNGMVLVQAPEGGHAAAAALEAVRRSGRTVTGFSGPWGRSEERRVGEEWRSRWSPDHSKKKK